MDWERFAPEASIDVDFCATALYCNVEKGSNMAMEVSNLKSVNKFCALLNRLWSVNRVRRSGTI